MAISNSDRVVTKQDLAEFYGQILPYLGGMPEAIANKFSRSALYSADEKIVGCWIDGKPLYQKTYLVTIPTRGNRTAIVTDETFDRIVNSEISANKVSGNNRFRFGSSASYGFGANDVAVYVEGNTVYIGNESSTDSYGGGDAYVTIQYTKTTDSANSFNFSTETDYSLDEHIVGTWIDGKPIYQKTVRVDLPSTAAGTHVVCTDSTIDCAIDIFGKFAWYDNANASGDIPIPITSGGYGVISYFNKPAHQVMLEVFGTATFIYNSQTAYITIQYTKTTD